MPEQPDPALSPAAEDAPKPEESLAHDSTPAIAPVAQAAPEVQPGAGPEAAIRPSPAEAKPEEEGEAVAAVPAAAAPGSSDGAPEAAATSQEILKRLEALEASVARQLDQLSASHGARIATIKVSRACAHLPAHAC